MTKPEVIKVLGAPHSTKADNKKEILEYRFVPDWTADHREQFWVTLENGKVIQYGRAGDFGSAMPQDRREYNIKLKQQTVTRR